MTKIERLHAAELKLWIAATSRFATYQYPDPHFAMAQICCNKAAQISGRIQAMMEMGIN